MNWVPNYKAMQKASGYESPGESNPCMRVVPFSDRFQLVCNRRVLRHNPRQFFEQL